MLRSLARSQGRGKVARRVHCRSPPAIQACPSIQLPCHVANDAARYAALLRPASLTVQHELRRWVCMDTRVVAGPASACCTDVDSQNRCSAQMRECCASGPCAHPAAGGLEALAPDSAAAAVARFEPRAAALLLEEEVREAVIGTAGAALGAPLSNASAPREGCDPVECSTLRCAVLRRHTPLLQGSGRPSTICHAHQGANAS